jgi:hypothetical protein
VSAASRAGLKTAYYLVLGREALDRVFGEVEVAKESLVDLATGVMAAAK